jgi:ribonucleoside-diphosphate reductase alpha subunit
MDKTKETKELKETNKMYVTKRDGTKEEISFDKILRRVKKLGEEANLNINYSTLAIKVIDKLCNNIGTTQIDLETADQCAALSTQHPDYGELAGRVLISNHQKNTDPSFSNTMRALFEFIDIHGNHYPLISKELWATVEEYAAELDDMIVNDRDYLIDYFGFKTLERSYLFSINKKIVERPQYMWMRVALGIHGGDICAAKETYDLMSLKYFTHATPTLFNAGTSHPQLSSCYLLAMEDDSLDGIYNTLHDCASISKWAGGIGLHIHNVRATGTHIRGTNGSSTGIVPMLKVFNDTARYIDQGSKRKGSFAIYLEPWHPDIIDFLELKKNHGDENVKARDLFYALWIPDLFMERVKTGGLWTLMCPHKCPGLNKLYGQKFNDLYEEYECKGAGNITMPARELWYKILDAQMETGTPYLLYKDAANKKSNQQNLGTIMSSNLCSEIIEYSDDNETAVCNLASIALPTYVNVATREFDYEKLHEVAKVVTKNLNKVIDINFYPTEKTRRSNLLHRPIGIGVQGLADTFVLMDIAFHSEEAKKVNKHIFETIYHAALEQSNDLAKERQDNIKREMWGMTTWDMTTHSISPHIGLQLYKWLGISGNKNESNNDNAPIDPLAQIYFNNVENVLCREVIQNKCVGAYSSFEGSPASEGKLQFDLWGLTQEHEEGERYNWAKLKDKIVNYGLRNSLLIAPMPTASTSQILGFNECFEPFTSNIYKRTTLAGEFTVVNKYLMNELIQQGVWSEQIKNNIIANGGSVQQLPMLSDHMKNKYKIVWEMPMRHIIDMAADRGVYICQSQSMNLWVQDPNYGILNSMHFHAWSKGLKTGIYYLRRKAKHQTQQFTIEPEKKEQLQEQVQDENDICDFCSA